MISGFGKSPCRKSANSPKYSSNCSSTCHPHSLFLKARDTLKLLTVYFSSQERDIKHQQTSFCLSNKFNTNSLSTYWLSGLVLTLLKPSHETFMVIGVSRCDSSAICIGPESLSGWKTEQPSNRCLDAAKVSSSYGI